jgi:hypothetical protein
MIPNMTTMSAVAVVLDKQLPSGFPEDHARILNAILSMTGVRVDRPVHTILSPGSRDRSRVIIVAICQHYFSEALGSEYDANRLTIAPFDYPEAGTGGVVVSHP